MEVKSSFECKGETKAILAARTIKNPFRDRICDILPKVHCFHLLSFAVGDLEFLLQIGLDVINWDQCEKLQ